jgi:hypothetical protein
VLVAAVHTKSRLGGAMAAGAWCVGALVFGALAFQTRMSIKFLGVDVPPWVYFAFMGGLLLFNGLVIARAFRRRRTTARAAGTGPTPGAS